MWNIELFKRISINIKYLHDYNLQNQYASIYYVNHPATKTEDLKKYSARSALKNC